jgi:small subunit ribosomal protein S13
LAEKDHSPEENMQDKPKHQQSTEERKPQHKKDTDDTGGVSAEQPTGKQDQQKKKDKKGKQGAKEAEPQVKKKEHGENFNYIVRLVNTDINGEKNIVQGLTEITGIGRHLAVLIADNAGVDRKIKFGDLPEPQIEKIKEIIENIDEYAPTWMLNHQKDYYSGEDLHLISTDVTTQLRDDINMMKMIRCYRGVRHELGLKVRGQRTSSNGRKGLALGVSKRKEAPAATGKKEEPAAKSAAKPAAAKEKKEAPK